MKDREGLRRALAASSLLLAAFSIAPAREAAEEPAGGPSAGPLRLEFDTRVPSELLRLVQGRIIDDDSLDAWVDLPGNAELLRIGAIRGQLTREQLRENLWHAVLGHAERRGAGLGSLAFDPLGDLERMLEELHAKRDGILRRVQAVAGPYMPPQLGAVEATVRLHVGGSWSGRTSNAIFVDMGFLHGFERPWMDGVDSIIAHEVIHWAHRQVSPLPSDGASSEALFGAALSQIQAEGVARHVEYQLLGGAHPEGSYGSVARRRYDNALAGFHAAFPRLEEIRTLCMRSRDIAGCRELVQKGLGKGGATYIIGHGMANGIERALGRGTLVATLAEGPVRFFDLYLQATRMLPGFPTPGAGFETDLSSAGEALDAERRLWTLRLSASRAHGAGDFDEAAAILAGMMKLAPRDPVGAYNLACALARSGEEKAAVEWLGRSFDLGYGNVEHMIADPDLDGLRERSDYRLLLERLSPGASGEPKSSMK